MNKKIETPTEMKVGKLDDLRRGNNTRFSIFGDEASVNSYPDSELMDINSMSLHEAALFYAEQGYAVLPCRGKIPAKKGGYKNGTTDLAVIDGWWHESLDYNIGIATGEVSGIFVLDIDGDAGEESIRKLEAENGPLPETWTIKTGGGGRHLWFNSPQGRIIGNRAGIVDKVDIRGNGGHAIVPPSMHESGNVYELVNDCEVANAPEWLLNLIGSKTGSTNPSAELSELEQSNVETTNYGRSALESECKLLSQVQEGNRNNELNNSAFKLAQLIAKDELNFEETYQGLYAAASDAGLREGIKKTLISGLTAGYSNPRQKDIVKFEDKPKPLVSGVKDLPEVPLSLFPEVMRSTIMCVAYSIQVPIELALNVFLGCIAAVVQNKITVQVTSDHSEPLNIFSICVLPPGERKSPTVSFFKKPIIKWEHDQYLVLKQSIDDAELRFELLSKTIDHKKRQVAKAIDSEQRENLFDEIKKMQEELPVIPVAPRLFIDDITPEALGERLSMHNESLAIIESEGGIFETLGGRYSRGVPNIDCNLKSWGGERCTIDRKGREPICLERPLLTMSLNVQPKVLFDMLGHDHFVGKGLSARFIYFLPKSKAGTRDIEVPPVDAAIIKKYNQLINRLLEIPFVSGDGEKAKSHCISLTPQAKEIWRNYGSKFEAKLNAGESMEDICEWGNKLNGQIIRLAGIIHCVGTESPHLKPIQGETMEAACKLAEVLEVHALAAHGFAEEDKDIKCANKILDRIKKDKICEFSERQMFEKIKGSFKSMDMTRKGVKVLLGGLYIKEIPVYRSGKGRKPSPKYMVSPYITGEYED